MEITLIENPMFGRKNLTFEDNNLQKMFEKVSTRRKNVMPYDLKFLESLGVKYVIKK